MYDAAPAFLRWRPFFSLFAVFLFFIFLFPVSAPAQGFFQDWLNYKKMVEPTPVEVVEEKQEPIILFLDAGHGGSDLGVQSSRHVLEKSVALNIVKAIKKNLAGYDRIEVITSRISDIEMKQIERVNLANASNASVFISIHAGGGMAPRSNPMKIFINKPKETDGENESWLTLNDRFSKENNILAEKIGGELDKKNPERGVGIVRTDRLYLGGLKMTAVLVEAVDLSNPEDEMRIEEGAHLNVMADAITDGLLDFLVSSGKFGSDEPGGGQ